MRSLRGEYLAGYLLRYATIDVQYEMFRMKYSLFDNPALCNTVIFFERRRGISPSLPSNVYKSIKVRRFLFAVNYAHVTILIIKLNTVSQMSRHFFLEEKRKKRTRTSRVMNQTRSVRCLTAAELVSIGVQLRPTRVRKHLVK